jgi:hypothetical protein
VSAVHLATYLDFLRTSEQTLGRGYHLVTDGHAADADVHWMTARFARQCTDHATALAPVLARYAPTPEPAPESLHAPGLDAARTGPAGLLRDLLDLYQLANLVDIAWSLIRQTAQAGRDHDLLAVTDHCATDTTAQLAWLRMRVRAAAPQTLLVAP